MKKISISILTIAVTISIVAGVTGAFFTDKESIDENSFTAGTVDINLSIGGEAAYPLVLDNLAPGVWTEGKIYKIYNHQHSLPVKYKYMGDITSESATGFSDKVNVKITHTGNIPVGDPSTWTLVYNGPLKDLLIDSTSTAGIDTITLDSNKTHHFYTEYQLDPTTGNDFADASMTFDLDFFATQTNNPGWTQ